MTDCSPLHTIANSHIRIRFFWHVFEDIISSIQFFSNNLRLYLNVIHVLFKSSSSQPKYFFNRICDMHLVIIMLSWSHIRDIEEILCLGMNMWWSVDTHVAFSRWSCPSLRVSWTGMSYTNQNKFAFVYLIRCSAHKYELTHIHIRPHQQIWTELNSRELTSLKIIETWLHTYILLLFICS